MKQDRTEAETAEAVGRELAAFNRADKPLSRDAAEEIVARMIEARASTEKDALALVSAAHCLFGGLMAIRPPLAMVPENLDAFCGEDLIAHSIANLLAHAIRVLEAATKTPPGTYTGTGPLMN